MCRGADIAGVAFKFNLQIGILFQHIDHVVKEVCKLLFDIPLIEIKQDAVDLEADYSCFGNGTFTPNPP